ncbi:MAG: DM13 domain-containing protein [Polaromonas sp.]|nr:DM13 domain-containing protein [Polaromonas sp.]
MKKVLLLVASHLAVLAAGFALGIYLLPILTAPDGPTASQVQAATGDAVFRGRFQRNLSGSDLLHWGEGEVLIGKRSISLIGKVSPGPDYKLYLVPAFVEDEAQFLKLKSQSLRIGDIKTFENFIVPVPDGVDIERFNTVLVWCETFSEFISATKYR